MNTPSEKDILQAVALQTLYDDMFARQRGMCWIVEWNRAASTYSLASKLNANQAYQAFRYRSAFRAINQADVIPIGIVRDGVVLAQRRQEDEKISRRTMHGHSDADAAYQRGYLHGWEGYTPDNVYPNEERAYSVGYQTGERERIAEQKQNA